MCAGITVYSPLVYYGVTKGMKVAVAGLGGLGSMAVKFAVAMGCDVTVLSRGTAKKEEAINRLGAHHFINSSVQEETKEAANRFDRIIDTIAAEHDVRALLHMTATNGKVIMVGAPPAPFMVHAFDLIPKRKVLAASMIGGIKETQEMLDYCGANNIFCEVEVIKPDYINQAYDRAVNSDVRYRFSIDVSHM